MNCPSRTDEPEGTGMNQNPNALSADLTTREDLNGKANSRMLTRSLGVIEQLPDDELRESNKALRMDGEPQVGPPGEGAGDGAGDGSRDNRVSKLLIKYRDVLKKFGKFCGPGMMVWE
jgi:metal iron transporter